MNDSNLNEALKLVQAGFFVTPLDGQRPIGFTNDPDVVNLIWSRLPDANIGLALGPSNKICALRVTPQEGGLESLKGLIKECGSLEETPQAESLMGVRLYFFKYYPNFFIPNKFKKGLRALKRGIILLPPSIYISGKRFLYKKDYELINFPLADIPEFLIRKSDAVEVSKKVNRLSIYEKADRRLCIFEPNAVV